MTTALTGGVRTLEQREELHNVRTPILTVQQTWCWRTGTVALHRGMLEPLTLELLTVVACNWTHRLW